MSQNGRETKAERKERARRERLALEAKAKQGKRTRTIALGTAAVVVVAVVAYVATRPTPPPPAPEGLDALLASATAAATSAGCGEVQTVGAYQPDSLDRSHVGGADLPEMPALATYPSIPPTSGPHDPSVLAAGVYDSAPDLGTALHSLEHGGTIVFYDPEAPESAIRSLTDLYIREDLAGERVIVAPYDYPDEGAAGLLPAGTQMALVAWHHLQTCTSVDPAAAFGFTARYSFPTYTGETYLGDAPEPGAQM
ncbi:MAG: DUF3105 domain-containing protein [Actinomycetota bacterium]